MSQHQHEEIEQLKKDTDKLALAGHALMYLICLSIGFVIGIHYCINI